MTAETLAELETRPPATWQALLAERFPDQPQLVQQALLWLHANRDEGASPDEPPSLGADRYELGVLLDSGATASVWQAYDRKLARNVAIKIFRESPELDEILAEARAACDVISDHVVRVLDVHDADPAYIVMELVGEHEPKRGTLVPGASAATSRPHDLDEAVRWVRDIARGVHDAHLRNVFHRDLKPHNVLITPVSRRAKIADFGLAVSTKGAPSSAKPIGLVVETGAGPARIAGTPEFMAPEQARGLAVALNPRAVDDRDVLVGVDVWGLGAVAYELLSGTPPWRAIGDLEPWEVAASGQATEVLDRIPKRLARIVQRALAPERRDRYASAGDLAVELDAFLARRPTSFDRSVAVRFGLWARRNPQLTITAVVAAVLATMSLVAYVAIGHLRDQRAALAAEMTVLSDQAKAAHHELEETAENVRAQSATLATLRRALSEAKTDFAAIVAAKEEALRSADAATKQLANQLATARSDRDTAELGRQMYEGFFARARQEADEAARERDAAQHDRDAARAERDQLTKDRDATNAARTAAEHDRDAARAERDREASTRRRVEADLAHLAAELATVHTAVDAGVADSPPAK